jgi:hypothetical protein
MNNKNHTACSRGLAARRAGVYSCTGAALVAIPVAPYYTYTSKTITTIIIITMIVVAFLVRSYNSRLSAVACVGFIIIDIYTRHYIILLY